MKIVLDAAVLVRANEHSLGLARDLLDTIVRGEHVLLLSSEMLYELARVLRYPRLHRLYGLSETQVYNYTGYLRNSAEMVLLNPLVIAPIRDVNDIIVMQTAIIGDADIICTRDVDFFEPPALEYLKNAGIAVMDDITLMHILRSPQQRLM